MRVDTALKSGERRFLKQKGKNKRRNLEPQEGIRNKAKSRNALRTTDFPPRGFSESGVVAPKL